MLDQRLQSHLLCGHSLTTPTEVVQHYGCMQAQDIRWAKRCIASRLDSCRMEEIDTAIADRAIVRTRPMRGTLHYIDPQHVYWMLDLCASKTLKGFAKRREFLGITDAHAEKALALMDSALRGGKALTRKDLNAYLLTQGIPMDKQWVYHLICYAATMKLICFGPTKDNEETIVLLDEWLPDSPQLTREEQLATLARMYIRSHGPVTIDDFAWRTGLGKTLCKEAFSLIEHELETNVWQGRHYYSIKIPPKPPFSRREYRLLGGFDEYFIAYKDRSPIADIDHHRKLFSKNGIFYPLIMVDGQIVGTWKRTIKKETVDIVCTLLDQGEIVTSAFTIEVTKYTAFLGRSLGSISYG